MVVVISASGKYDFVVLTSINFALAKVGGPVVPYSPTDNFSKVERLAFVGHGSIGKIQELTGEQLGDHLANDPKGVTGQLKKLIVTSCYAGSRVHDKAGTSFVEILAKKLRGRGVGGLEIVGYCGPSIKSAALGGHVRVVDPAKDVTVDFQTGDTRADQLQDESLAPYANQLTSQKTAFAKDDMEILALRAQLTSANFYRSFVEKLDKENLLLKGDEVARVAVVLD